MFCESEASICRYKVGNPIDALSLSIFFFKFYKNLGFLRVGIDNSFLIL